MRSIVNKADFSVLVIKINALLHNVELSRNLRCINRRFFFHFQPRSKTRFTPQNYICKTAEPQKTQMLTITCFTEWFYLRTIPQGLNGGPFYERVIVRKWSNGTQNTIF